MLSLLEFSDTEPVRNGDMQLAFPSALSPHVALDVSGPQPLVYVMTARGILHAITLPGRQDGQRLGGPQNSILSNMPTDGSAIASADLSNGKTLLTPDSSHLKRPSG